MCNRASKEYLSYDVDVFLTEPEKPQTLYAGYSAFGFESNLRPAEYEKHETAIAKFGVYFWMKWRNVRSCVAFES